MYTLSSQIKNCKNISEVLAVTLEYLSQVSKTKTIAFVSGPITADGLERIDQNKQRLFAAKQDLQQKNPELFVFCDQDIFADIQGTMNICKAVYQDYLDFYDKLFYSRNISILFLTPRWEISTGAKREYELAKLLGIKIIKL